MLYVFITDCAAVLDILPSSMKLTIVEILEGKIGLFITIMHNIICCIHK